LRDSTQASYKDYRTKTNDYSSACAAKENIKRLDKLSMLATGAQDRLVDHLVQLREGYCPGGDSSEVDFGSGMFHGERLDLG
jgi:hypothetical protein